MGTKRVPFQVSRTRSTGRANPKNKAMKKVHQITDAYRRRYTKRHTQKDGVVIHWTVMREKDMIPHLRRQGTTSYHYIAGEDKLYQAVNSDYIAHHAGNWEANKSKVGLALIGAYSEDTKPPKQSAHDNASQLLAKIGRDHDIEKFEYGKNVFKHSDVRNRPTECCGSTDVDYIINKANNILMSKDDTLIQTMQKIAYAYLDTFGTAPSYRYMKHEAKQIQKGSVDLSDIRRLWNDKSKDYYKHYANIWQYLANHEGLKDAYKVKSGKDIYNTVELHYSDILAHYIQHGIPEGVTDLM